MKLREYSKSLNPIFYLYSFLVLGLLVVIFFQFFPLKVIKSNVQPYRVLTKEINAGENIIVTVDYCKYLPVEVEYYVQFFGVDNNEVGTTTPRLISDLSVGCKKIDLHYPTPESLPTGKYYGLARAKSRLTVIQSIFYEDRYVSRTEEFTISETKSIREIVKEISAIINNYYVVENENSKTPGNSKK